MTIFCLIVDVWHFDIFIVKIHTECRLDLLLPIWTRVVCMQANSFLCLNLVELESFRVETCRVWLLIECGVRAAGVLSWTYLAKRRHFSIQSSLCSPFFPLLINYKLRFITKSNKIDWGGSFWKTKSKLRNKWKESKRESK